MYFVHFSMSNVHILCCASLKQQVDKEKNVDDIFDELIKDWGAKKSLNSECVPRMAMSYVCGKTCVAYGSRKI